jgi:hypothetical protein
MWLGSNPMSNVDEDWERSMLKRFAGRENLSFDELYNRYFHEFELPKEGVRECLQMLESEYKISVGVLRPDDKLKELFTPIPAKTLWQWLVFRTREGDSESEINYELGKRLRSAGTIHSWSHIKRFGDMRVLELLRAWCGLTPLFDESMK